MCFFHILLKNTQPDAEAIYKLWQLLSEGTLIKAMTVLMLSLEVSGVPLIDYWGSLTAYKNLLGLASHVPNALKTIDNQLIYCFYKCFGT
jgi:hypothetical protein